MTTDPFTEAARAEAERRHPDPVDVETGEPVDDWGFEEQGRRDFQAGAGWARHHLAARKTDHGYGPKTTEAVRVWTGAWPAVHETTDYQIDVAMDAYAEASGQSVSRPWMEAAIDAYESAARRDEGARDG